MQVYICKNIVPSSVGALPRHMLCVSVVASTPGRLLSVEIIRLWKKRKEQSYVKNLLVLKHLLKQGPRILAIQRSTNVAGDLSTVVCLSQIFGGVNLINIGCIDFIIMNHRALILVVISAYFSSTSNFSLRGWYDEAKYEGSIIVKWLKNILTIKQRI